MDNGKPSVIDKVKSIANEAVVRFNDVLKNGIMNKDTEVTMDSKVKKSFYNTIYGLSTSLKDIDLGSISPKITPVLDLSSVEAGAKKMNNLLNTDKLNLNINPSNKVFGSVSGVVKSDTGKLLDAISSKVQAAGTTINNNYSVNGITYDDGSNVSTAIVIS